jgi:hypothetical protein
MSEDCVDVGTPATAVSERISAVRDVLDSALEQSVPFRLGGLCPEVVDGSLSARPKEYVPGAVLQVLRRDDQTCNRN